MRRDRRAWARGRSRRRRVLTHCNAGALATGGIGTALAPIYRGAPGRSPGASLRRRDAPAAAGRPAHRVGAHPRRHSVHADRRQHGGEPAAARATSTCVIVGADRIAANGDTANKIGTYPLALAAKAHGVPFYVAAPTVHLRPRDAQRRRDPDRGAPCGRDHDARRAPDRARRRGGLESGVRRDAGALITGFITDRGPADARRDLDPRARPGHDRLDGAGRARGRPHHRPRAIASSRSTSPSPGGSSTIRSRSSRVARGDARSASPRPARSPAALGITNQRETVVLWDREPASRWHRAIVWQDRRTAARCRELREAGLEPMIRRAHRPRLRSLLLRDQARVAAARTRRCVPPPSAATSRREPSTPGSWPG